MKVQFRLNKSNWHIFQLLLLLILFASLFSCAGKTATGKSEKQLEVVPLERAYENIFFDTFETTEIIKKDYPLAVIECQASAITWLNMKNVFSRVENIKGKTEFDDKTLLVKAQITEIRIVSGAARFWGGAFAGSSNINLKIKLIIMATLFRGIKGKGIKNHSTAAFISEDRVVETNDRPKKTTRKRRQQTIAAS